MLKINVDLMVYRARGYTQQAYMAKSPAGRRPLFDQAEVAFRRCLEWDLTDGRAYVGLGKLLVRSRKFQEARELYEEGTRMVGMENPFIWQVRQLCVQLGLRTTHACACSERFLRGGAARRTAMKKLRIE